jgi:hypothetical protein
VTRHRVDRGGPLLGWFVPLDGFVVGRGEAVDGADEPDG